MRFAFMNNNSLDADISSMKRIFFFATPIDIVPVLARFEAAAPLKFVEMGVTTTPNRPIYLTSSEIPNPGIATHETGFMSRAYLVSLRDTKNSINTFIDRNGEKRWSLQNSDNEDTVILTIAGLWKTGTLLPGNISTLHANPTAQQLMKRFQSALRREGFSRIQGWWLGAEALERLKAGKRLTVTAEQSPPQFDFALSTVD